MRIVINVGICLGMGALTLMLLFFARNVIWNIPDNQLAKIQKYKLLCGIALALGVLLYCFMPHYFGNQNNFISKTALTYPSQTSNTPQLKQPAVMQSSSTSSQNKFLRQIDGNAFCEPVFVNGRHYTFATADSIDGLIVRLVFLDGQTKDIHIPKDAKNYALPNGIESMAFKTENKQATSIAVYLDP